MNKAMNTTNTANKRLNVKTIAVTAMFAALIYAATAFLHIPAINGYVHLGDALIYLAASVLPIPYGRIAAGLGGFLADALTGYMIFAPGTLIVKVLLTIAFTSKREKMICPRNLIAVLIAFPITIGGYFLYSWIVFDFASAFAEILSNLGQAAGSAVLYIVLAFALDRIGFKKKLSKLNG